MDGSPQAAVTPQGVRDGDPAVLAALVARRGPAVLAFCEAVCAPGDVPDAVAEAFARFRALVATVGDTGDVDPEAYLLGATRHAAAAMARAPTDGRGVLRALGRGTSPETYAAVPALLAARADSMLGAEDLERLSRLLERSPGCREVEASFRRAERGYRSPPDRPLSGTTTALVISAMQAAAPVAQAFADGAPDVPPPAAPPPADDAASHEQPTAVHAVADPTPPVAETAGVAPAAEPASAEAPDEPAPFLLPQEPVEPAEPAQDPGPDVAPPADPAPEFSQGLAAAAPEPSLDPAFPDPGPEAFPLVAAATPDPYAQPEADRPAAVAVAAGGAPGRRRVGRPRLGGLHGGGLSLPRRGALREDDGTAPVDPGPVYRLLLPAVAILIALLVMLAIAGVFGGGDPAPAAVLAPSVAATTGTLPTAGVAAVPAPAPRSTRPRHRRAARRPAARTAVTATSSSSAPSAPVASPVPASTPVATATATAAAPAPTAVRPAPAPAPTAAPTAGKTAATGALPGSGGSSDSSTDPVYQPGSP